MAVVDLVSGYAGNYRVNKEILDGPVLLKRFIDTTVTPLVSGNTYEIFKYDANSLIKSAFLITETVEGAVETVDLMSASSGAVTLIDNHDLNTDNKVTGYTTGTFASATNYICILANAAITAAKFWVGVEIVKFKNTD